MLFISYSWGDARRAHAIVDAIRKTGQSVWLDVSHLDLSADIESQLVNAIDRASLFLHLDSRHSRNSAWVAFERAMANQFKKTIFDIPSELLEDAVVGRPHNNSLHTEPRVTRFLQSMSFAAAR